jgi:hypothetical protein
MRAMNSTIGPFEIDGSALVRAKSRSKKDFERLVETYRAAGFSDKEMLDAMVRSRSLVDSLGRER